LKAVVGDDEADKEKEDDRAPGVNVGAAECAAGDAKDRGGGASGEGEANDPWFPGSS
jgi:hypothetical protein